MFFDTLHIITLCIWQLSRFCFCVALLSSEENMLVHTNIFVHSRSLQLQCSYILLPIGG
jgi:hypothetical protein